MDFPAQRPDLNPIENFWEELDRNLRLTRLTRGADLIRNLKATWQVIEEGTIIKLLE